MQTYCLETWHRGINLLTAAAIREREKNVKENKAMIMEGVKDYQRARIVGNNTVEYWKGTDKIIRLHHTDIVTFKKNGDIVLNSGLWKTPTTKDRINSAIPGRGVSQNKGVWYIRGVVFADGMKLHPDGTVSGAGGDPKETAKVVKQIKKYVTGFMAALQAREVPQPSNGDCFGCALKDKKTHETVMGTDHLLSHFEEKYYVPSLLMNAIETFPISSWGRSCVGYWLKYYESDPSGNMESIGVDQVKKSLTRYLKRQLGIATN